MITLWIGLIVSLAVISCLSLVINYRNWRELQQMHELTTQLKLTESELNYAQISQQQLQQDLSQVREKVQAYELDNKSLQQTNLELVASNRQLSAENQHLTQAYTQLQTLTEELKISLTREFSQLKNLAVSELREKAGDSLREVGRHSVVEPLQEQLKELQHKLHELNFQTREINRSSAGLNEQARNLALALTKDSKKKGDFGELMLANILESVGLHKYICYLEQEQIQLDGNRLIPDCIIKLPHDKAVVIDSKNIMQSYYLSIVENSDSNKAILDAIRTTIKQLSNKDYTAAVAHALQRSVLDYVIMFIPNDSLFNLIIDEDQRLHGTLLKEAYQQQVFIAGPSTLLVLLGMIERSWDTYQIEERTAQIMQLAQELTVKLKTSLKRISELGLALRQTGARYDDVIKSLDNGASNSAMGKLEQLVELAGDKQGLIKPALAGELAPRLAQTVADTSHG